MPFFLRRSEKENSARGFFRSKSLNARSVLLNGRSELLNVCSVLLNEDFIVMFFLFRHDFGIMIGCIGGQIAC